MLESAYIGLSTLMLFILIFGIQIALKRYTTDAAKKKNIQRIFLIGILLWLGWLFFLSQSKILLDLSLPPKFILLLFLPFVSFLLVFYFTQRDNAFIQSIPKSWTANIQSFRILVETLLLYTFLRGIIPASATFEGWNFDILMGISAPILAYLAYKKKLIPRGIAYAWNILGILMVMFVGFIIGTSTYLPEIWGETATMVREEFFTLPFLLIPGFLAPMAIFIHVVSLIQLKKWEAQKK